MGMIDDLVDKVPMVKELKKAAGNWSGDPNESIGTKLYKMVGPKKGPVTTPEGNKYLDDAIEEARKRAVERGQIKDVKAKPAAKMPVKGPAPMDVLAAPPMPKKKKK